MVLRSHSVFDMLFTLTISMVQNYSQALNTENTCLVCPFEGVSKMEFVVSVTVFAICGDACFNRPIRVYVIERIDKFVTYPLIIIKSEVSTFPIVI